VVALFVMAKVAEKTKRQEMTSAEIIRELRGPLPEDDPEYQRFLERGETPSRSAQDEEAIESVRRELAALPPGTKLSNEELFALLDRLPRRPSDWTSADVIREHRGPLPENDPDFADVDRR
jgi:hypothetical protein